MRNTIFRSIKTEYKERYKRFEFYIFLCYLALLTISFFAVKSANMNTALESSSSKHLVLILFGIFLFFLTIILPERFLRRFIPVLFFLTVAALAFVLAAPKISGSRRWISLGFFNFQPSEYFKLAEILFLSEVLAVRNSKVYYLACLSIFFSAILIYKEPDLGTTLIVLSMWLVMTIACAKHERIWKGAVWGAILASPVAFFMIQDYQRDRILSIFSPQQNATGAAYNTIQSMRAIGSGGILGKGYMNGNMNLGNFVPEDHTDFIISVIGEEFGFIGICLILFLYAVILYRLYRGFSLSYDFFWKFYFLGSSFLIFFHVFENIGMNLGIMPVTGVPLPLISWGGNQIITYSILLGLATKGCIVNKNKRQG